MKKNGTKSGNGATVTIEIGQRVMLSPLCQFQLDDVRRLQTSATVGTVYNITRLKYSQTVISVDFGEHGRWWFVEDDLEVVE